MAEEPKKENEWKQYATIEAVGDVQKFKDTILPVIEKAYNERLWFENAFLRTKDGKLADYAMLAPVTAAYRKKVLDDYKAGKTKGFFHLGQEEKCNIYVDIAEETNKLVLNFYIDNYDDSEEYKERWSKTVANEVSYFAELGFSVSLKRIDDKDAEIFNVVSTEDDLIKLLITYDDLNKHYNGLPKLVYDNNEIFSEEIAKKMGIEPTQNQIWDIEQILSMLDEQGYVLKSKHKEIHEVPFSYWTTSYIPTEKLKILVSHSSKK